jgi:hypothetical protein
MLKAKRSPAAQITLPPIEVVVPAADGQYPASQSSQYGSDIDVHEDRYNKPNGLVIDHDLESGLAE